VRARRLLLSTVAAVGLVAGLGITGAAPASAASADPAGALVACGSGVNGSQNQIFTGAVGDTFTLTSSGANCWIASTGGVFAGTITLADGYSGIVTVTGTVPESGADIFGSYYGNMVATFTIVGSGSFTLGHGGGIQYSSTITVIAVDGPASAASIPAWVQAYGRASADAKCQDGWDASWQEWAQDVTGGWVCTRSIPANG
jgi:hypothetical protein